MSSPHPDADAVVVPCCAGLKVSDTRAPDTDKSGNLMRSRLAKAQHQVIADALVKRV
ncbi:MAG: hypothetical protein AAGG53_10360 [Cyanobacteria bacterium P01_H01_bin.152]